MMTWREMRTSRRRLVSKCTTLLLDSEQQQPGREGEGVRQHCETTHLAGVTPTRTTMKVE